MKVRKLSQETKSRISQSLTGRTISTEVRQRMSDAQKGRKLSLEHRKKLSDSRKRFHKNGGKQALFGKPNYKIRGENHYNWKGGVSTENRVIRKRVDFRLWRESVFARDNWTCQKYGIRGYELHPHHIKNFAEFPELRFSVENGITLSRQAHNEFHGLYGKRNNSEEQLQEFLLAK